MKIISTRVHGILDYVMGVLLISAPFIFGFTRGAAETWIPVLLGMSTIIYSLLTDYEYGAFKTITMKNHLRLDFIQGAFLIISPWLFNFDGYISTPHVIIGFTEILMVMMTSTIPSETFEYRRHRHAH
jgi:hypothetical protein